MTIRVLIFAIITSLFTITMSSAQSAQNGSAINASAANVGKVTGRLVDATNKPISYATVTLLRADSTVVSGDLTKDDGSFSIAPTGTGNFMLKADAIGYKSKIQKVTVTAANPNVDMGIVKIGTGTTTLKEVNVVAEKELMHMDVDKKVFNVEQNITTAGGSASDVLSNVPGVSVDVDGNVSLRNDANVTVLIDGKPSTLLGSDQASALQSLPAASIESVEVITNPSAKYDAQGPTGIINIITKKDTRLGVNGSATLGAGTGDKYNGSLNLNAHKGKWNVFLNSSFRLNSHYNNTSTDRTNHSSYTDASGIVHNNDSFYHTFEHGQRHFDGNFNTIGATYNFNKRSSITFTQNVNIMSFNTVDTSNYQSFGSSNYTDRNTMQRRFTKSQGGPFSLSEALDYTTKFKKTGEELNLDATFANTTFFRNQYYYTGITNPYVQDSTYYESVPGNGHNQTFNAWADYTDPLFTKNGKLGLGFKSQLYWFNSSNNPIITLLPDSTKYTDYALLNKYSYTQQVQAAYVNWNDQLGKFSYQAGLRMEYSSYDGTDQVLSNNTYSNHFLDLFPSAFVSYKVDNQQSIYLNYSRRTNRPNFFQLLPYKDVSTPGLVNQGNPNLIPEFIHHIELSYNRNDNKGNNIFLSAYYQLTQNLIERVSYPILDSTSPYVGELFTIPENVAKAATYGFEGTAHLQFLPIWDATLDVNLFQNDINVSGADSAVAKYVTNQNGFSWIGKLNTTLRLPAGFSLQVNGNYESPKVLAQGKMQEVYWVDAALRKNLWNNKATVVANVSDIFNTRKYTTLYNLPSYDETYYRDRESRIGTITFTYRFGTNNQSQHAKNRQMKNQNAPEQPTDQDRENNLKQGDDNGGDSGGMGGGGGGAPKGAHS